MTTLEKLCRAACEAEGFDPERYWRTYEKAVNGVLKALEEQASEIAGNNTFDEELFNLCRQDDYAGIFTAMIRKAKEG